MLDISSMVYTRLVNHIQMKRYLKGSGTTRDDKPPAFPYLYFKNLGQPTMSSSLQNKQCAISADFEITIYDSDWGKVKQLIFLASDIMQAMGFTLKYGPLEVERASKSETYRWVARFHRTYCEGDLIETK